MGDNVCHSFTFYGFRGALHYPRTQPYNWPWNFTKKDHWIVNPSYQVIYEGIISFKNRYHWVSFLIHLNQ